MLRIDKAASFGFVNRIGNSDKELKGAMHKLATGKKINTAADDAAMMAVAKELLAQTRGMQQSSVNIGDALAVAGIADGAANSVHDMQQRMRELALQAKNGTLSDKQRGYLNQEYQALKEEVNRTAESAQYNGMSVANGQSPLSDGSGVIAAGANGETRSLGGFDLRMSDDSDISTLEGASGAISAMDDALDATTAQRADLGARVNGMEHARSNLDNQNINTTDALSRAEDLDFAQGVMDQVRAQLLNKTSTAAASQFNQISSSAMGALLS